MKPILLIRHELNPTTVRAELDGTTSHSTRLAQDTSQVAGYVEAPDSIHISTNSMRTDSWLNSALSIKIATLCLTFAGAPAAHADELGRLFFTPAQRTQLNYSKFQESDSDSDRSSLTVNGIVQQDGGARTAWINGVPRQAGQSDERNPGSMPVTVPSQPRPVTVKVGQKVNINPAHDSQP